MENYIREKSRKWKITVPDKNKEEWIKKYGKDYYYITLHDLWSPDGAMAIIFPEEYDKIMIDRKHKLRAKKLKRILNG